MIGQLAVLTTLLYNPTFAVVAIPVFIAYGRDRLGCLILIMCALGALQQTDSASAPINWFVDASAIRRTTLVLAWTFRFTLIVSLIQTFTERSNVVARMNLKHMLKNI